MPTGLKGQKRPPDVIANAVHVARVAIGEAQETYATVHSAEGNQQSCSPQQKPETGMAVATDPSRLIVQEAAVAKKRQPPFKHLA